MVQPNGSPPCLMKAWKKHEHELFAGYSDKWVMRLMLMI
jgi:hypothetical protein